MKARWIPALALALTVGLLASTSSAQGRSAPDVQDAKYGAHERNVLDLWLAEAEGPRPLLVFIHGGGFRGGSKAAIPGELVRTCLEAGVSVASINYRLSQDAPFPGPMHDGARAIQYLRHRATAWNLDPEKISVIGASAGGGMSLWLAFHDDLADLDSDDPVARRSTRVVCAIGLGAQTSYDPRRIKEIVGGRAHEHPALLPFYGLKAEQIDTPEAHELFAEASPETHLSVDDPPVLLWYDGVDKPGERPGAGIHSERFGTDLQTKMQALGLTCEVRVGLKDVTWKTPVEFLLRELEASK